MLLTASVVCSAFGQTPDSGRETLAAVASRDAKVVRRWQLPGDPRGVALGADGTIYAGLAQPQAIAAIDPNSGAVK
ncbi:MAG TPA: hypothetical protein VFN10_05740, partial [Thermoanaerobaculia bacterium]|nr:hypothetical protein [Thermoanaerobaculia bacterium]